MLEEIVPWRTWK